MRTLTTLMRTTGGLVTAYSLIFVTPMSEMSPVLTQLSMIAMRGVRSLLAGPLADLGCLEPSVSVSKIGHYQVILTTTYQAPYSSPHKVARLLESFWTDQMPELIETDFKYGMERSIQESDMLLSDCRRLCLYDSLIQSLNGSYAAFPVVWVPNKHEADLHTLATCLEKVTRVGFMYISGPDVDAHESTEDFRKVVGEPQHGASPWIDLWLVSQGQCQSEDHDVVFLSTWVSNLPTYPNENYVVAECVNACLGGLPNSVLMHRLRHESGLVYNVGSVYNPAFGVIIVFAGVPRRNVPSAIDLITSVVSNFAPTPELIGSASKYLRFQRGQLVSSPTALALYHLERHLYGAISEPCVERARFDTIDQESVARIISQCRISGMVNQR